MQYNYHDSRTKGRLRLLCAEPLLDQVPFRHGRLLTIAWNTGPTQQVIIDNLTYSMPAQSILPLMMSQSFAFEEPETIVAWQFDREFYCIADHDEEVSCAGFLFYGARIPMFIQLSDQEQHRFGALLTVFYDEFSTQDTIQGEMLRMLLKRLIIKLTRLGREQYVDGALSDKELTLVRRFNLLVEINYRTLHNVRAYADLLNKSPKTLANVFALYNQQSPRQIIHERIAMEARRLLLYSDKSTKEIAAELGFEEVSNFSRFFKKQIKLAPSDFRKENQNTLPDLGKS
ncbi:AraC family transcriptional regulator [Spirosoma sp. KUDC1026]|uniref:AraC family transcriptional regulator n=1 Tax=Spirosoma sp. KUDC1026 TaxID=2745947 RepID=UPI00159BDA75|nr:helix-turn-helix domain-containing protein [Spirosoma sp. KUDC1026]QKZ11355.1 helix-turn-helix domain-containing protein [Spirosoma sp. KUDC1026]